MIIKRLGTGWVAKHNASNSIGLGATYKEALGNLINVMIGEIT